MNNKIMENWKKIEEMLDENIVEKIEKENDGNMSKKALLAAYAREDEGIVEQLKDEFDIRLDGGFSTKFYVENHLQVILAPVKNKLMGKEFISFSELDNAVVEFGFMSGLDDCGALSDIAEEGSISFAADEEGYYHLEIGFEVLEGPSEEEKEFEYDPGSYLIQITKVDLN